MHRTAAQTPYDLVLGQLESQIVSGDALEGEEVPVSAAGNPTTPARSLAFRVGDNFSASGKLFTKWNGNPRYFTSLD